MVKPEVEALKSKINGLYQDQSMMGVWACRARSKTRSSALRRPGFVMKRYFEWLSKKLVAINSNQEKRHKMCARFEALEKNTSQLASDLMSLKEELKTLGGDLAAVKVQVENKVDEIKDSHFEKKINESQNRSRRHNMVFWNQFQCKEQ